MARGAYQPTAELLAQFHNYHRGSDAPYLPASQFNLYRKAKPVQSAGIYDMDSLEKAWANVSGGK